MSSSSIKDQNKDDVSVHEAPLVSSFNHYIRPLIDTVEELRRFKFIEESIKLPTIVLVGDQSSGKSTVLEFLTRISLSRGGEDKSGKDKGGKDKGGEDKGGEDKGGKDKGGEDEGGKNKGTRVPLILKLQNFSSAPKPIFVLEYDNQTFITTEKEVGEAIKDATQDIISQNKDTGFPNKPITVTVKRNGFPDLTMVDLPGIIPEAPTGHSKDIYKQISSIITEFITPEDSIILNVLSSNALIPSSESIKLSQKVDVNGQRSLVVFTMADAHPQSLALKVTDVGLALGSVCVSLRREANESYVDAQSKESRFFQGHPRLCNINKSFVGITALADKLVRIQGRIIRKRLPGILMKIYHQISSNEKLLNSLPYNLTIHEAMKIFVGFVNGVKESFKKIALDGDFDEYPNSKDMHLAARLAEMFKGYFSELQSQKEGENATDRFLIEEINVLEETKSLGLDFYLPKEAFHALLTRRIDAISEMSVELVQKIWKDIEAALMKIVAKRCACDDLMQLHAPVGEAINNLIGEKTQESIGYVTEALEMEKLTHYTCDWEFRPKVKILMEYENNFKECLKNKANNVTIPGIRENIPIGHLSDIEDVEGLGEAFELKMKMAVYWDIVRKRMVDSMVLHIRFQLAQIYLKVLENTLIDDIVGIKEEGDKLKILLEKSPVNSDNLKSFKEAIRRLKNAKMVIEEINDKFLVLRFN